MPENYTFDKSIGNIEYICQHIAKIIVTETTVKPKLIKSDIRQ